MIGETLGDYQITEELGAGGMGEVYRAEDTNFSRHVAIKVPRNEFAHEIGWLNRFESDVRLRLGKESPRR